MSSAGSLSYHYKWYFLSRIWWFDFSIPIVISDISVQPICTGYSDILNVFLRFWFWFLSILSLCPVNCYIRSLYNRYVLYMQPSVLGVIVLISINKAKKKKARNTQQTDSHGSGSQCPRTCTVGYDRLPTSRSLTRFLFFETGLLCSTGTSSSSSTNSAWINQWMIRTSTKVTCKNHRKDQLRKLDSEQTSKKTQHTSTAFLLFFDFGSATTGSVHEKKQRQEALLDTAGEIFQIHAQANQTLPPIVV